MGYVYTLQEWEEGRIARPENFPVAEEMVRIYVKDFCSNGIAVGANIVGSSFNGKGAPGSDIDVIVVTVGNAVSQLNAAKQGIKNATHVPIEWVTVKKENAQRGQHRINFHFREIAQTFYKDGIIEQDPFIFIAPKESWKNPVQEEIDSLAYKLEEELKLGANASPYREEHCNSLKG